MTRMIKLLFIYLFLIMNNICYSGTKFLATNDTSTMWVNNLDVYSTYFCIADDGNWDNESIPICEIKKNTTVTILQVDSVAIGTTSPTLTFHINERNWGNYNSSGTNITTTDIVADFDGTVITSFSNSSIAIQSGLFLTTGVGAESGQVDYIMGTIFWTVP